MPFPYAAIGAGLMGLGGIAGLFGGGDESRQGLSFDEQKKLIMLQHQLDQMPKWARIELKKLLKGGEGPSGFASRPSGIGSFADLMQRVSGATGRPTGGRPAPEMGALPPNLAQMMS